MGREIGARLRSLCRPVHPVADGKVIGNETVFKQEMLKERQGIDLLLDQAQAQGRVQMGAIGCQHGFFRAPHLTRHKAQRV